MSTDAVGTFVSRFLGAVLAGYALIVWFAKDFDVDPRQVVVRVHFVTSALGFAITLHYQLQPGSGFLSWAFVVLTGFFALAFGYYAISSSNPAPI
jgi:hypothetical protein